MIPTFVDYSDVLLESFIKNSRGADVVNKKKTILFDILKHYSLDLDDVLFVGFNPWMLAMGDRAFRVAEVSDKVLEWLKTQGCDCELIDVTNVIPKSSSIIVATDEYFTFAETDQEQRKLVEQLSQVARNLIITTLRDYKNQDYKDREFSQPLVISGSMENTIYLEYYKYDLQDKNASTSTTYAISDQLEVHGPFARRNMYFKQLAKFSMDAGAENFYVHKNLMYKSLIKKNYEHIITIKFGG
jgi:hypothetical protein